MRPESIRIAGARGAELEGWVAGRGEPGFLLLHGFPFDRAMWEPQVPELARRARVVAPDLRGLGASGLGHTRRARLDDHARDLADWMDAAGMERAVVAGLSMGGYVALEFWRRFPARVAALALVDTKAEEDLPAARRARDGAAGRIREAGMEAVAEEMLGAVLGRTTRRNRPRVVERVRRMILAAPPEGAIAALEAMRDRPDSTDDLRSIDVPALVLVGEEDSLTPPRVARGMAESIPRAELVIVPRCGHVASLEAPTAVTAELAALRERAAGSPA